MEPQERAAKIAARKARQKKLLAKKRGCEKRRFLEVSGCGCLKLTVLIRSYSATNHCQKPFFARSLWDYGAWRDSLTVIDQISCKGFSREIERHWESLSPMKHAIMKIEQDWHWDQPALQETCFSWMHRKNVVELWAWDILRHHWSFWFSSMSWERPRLECAWFHSIYCFNKDKIHIS